MADVINRDAYTQLLRKVNPALGTTPAQAAPAEAKAGKPAKAPLDVRTPAARNKPKPKPKHSAFAKRAGHNPPKPEFAESSKITSAWEKPQRGGLMQTAAPTQGRIADVVSGPGATLSRRANWQKFESEASPSENIEDVRKFAKRAGHNPPKPTHAHAGSKRVPKHLRGRGLISEKAMAAMSGPHDAAAARPWQGQKLPGWAASTHGKHDAAGAKSPNLKGETS